jgi:hypothetical protein
MVSVLHIEHHYPRTYKVSLSDWGIKYLDNPVNDQGLHKKDQHPEWHVDCKPQTLPSSDEREVTLAD